MGSSHTNLDKQLLHVGIPAHCTQGKNLDFHHHSICGVGFFRGYSEHGSQGIKPFPFYLIFTQYILIYSIYSGRLKHVCNAEFTIIKKKPFSISLFVSEWVRKSCVMQLSYAGFKWLFITWKHSSRPSKPQSHFMRQAMFLHWFFCLVISSEFSHRTVHQILKEGDP